MRQIDRVIGRLFALQLLAILLAGAIAAQRLDDALLHASVWIGGIAWLALAAATLAPPGRSLHAWRGTLQLAACWLIFPLFKAIRLVFIDHTADAALLQLDRQLWGGLSLPEHLLGSEKFWLSEVLSAGYFLFFFIVLIPVAGFSMQRRSQEAKLFFAGLTRMYLIGLTGYVLVPAGGPFMAFPDVFPYPVQGGPITAFLAGVVEKGITGMDVFPSLHAGIGAYVLGFFALGGYRRIALLLLPVVMALIAATLYLRYHYGIDVLCGLALAATVLVFVQRFRKESRAWPAYLPSLIRMPSR